MSRRTLRFSAQVDAGGEELETREFMAVAGWDRPLQRLHLTVYALPGEVIAWDCLRLPQPENMDLRDIERVVVGMGSGPVSLWLSYVRHDMQNDVGNAESIHFPDNVKKL